MVVENVPLMAHVCTITILSPHTYFNSLLFLLMVSGSLSIYWKTSDLNEINDWTLYNNGIRYQEGKCVSFLVHWRPIFVIVVFHSKLKIWKKCFRKACSYSKAIELVFWCFVVKQNWPRDWRKISYILKTILTQT